VFGSSSSTSGVRGESTGGDAVYGNSTGSSSYGVVGNSTGSGATAGGVHGVASGDAPGVFGENGVPNPNASGYGVKGTSGSTSSSAAGVYGNNTGAGAGVRGEHTSGGSQLSGHGVFGTTNSTNVGAAGGRFENTGAGYGLYGQGVGNVAACYFTNASTAANASGHGFEGSTDSSSTSAAGIKGSASGVATGGWFTSISGIPLLALGQASGQPVAKAKSAVAKTTALATSHGAILAAHDVNDSQVAGIWHSGRASLTPSPNYLHNGSFNVTEVNGNAFNLTYTGDSNRFTDRWIFRQDGTISTTIQLKTLTLNDLVAVSGDLADEPRYYIEIAKGSQSSGTFSPFLGQRVEGVRTLAGKTVTLSFWAKVPTIGFSLAAVVARQNFGTGGSPSATVITTQSTLSPSNAVTTSWQRFSATIAIPTVSGKTVGTNNDDFLQLSIEFTQNAGAQTFHVADVQLEEGPIATPFRYRSINEEIRLCARFFQKSFPSATAPGQNAGTSGEWSCTIITAAANAQSFYIYYPGGPLRATPTMTFYNPSAANALPVTLPGDRCYGYLGRGHLVGEGL
jgi:hypothetical protein